MSVTNSEEIKAPLFSNADYDSICALLHVPKRALEEKIITAFDVSKDTDHPLVSFHYDMVKVELLESKYNFTHDEALAIKQIRGVVIDMVDLERRASAFPYTQILIRSSIPEDGSFQLIEGDDSEFSNVSSGNVWKKRIPGTIVKVFADKTGKIFYSTNRRLSFKNSKFGSIRTFEQMFFENQDLFPYVEDEYASAEGGVFLPWISVGDSIDGLVLTFIICDRDLVVDSSEIINEDAVYFIKATRLNQPEIDEYSRMRSYILRLNIHAQKPILFPELINEERVNELLSGGMSIPANIRTCMSPAEISTELAKMSHRDVFKMFAPAESVILENDRGIFLVSPPQFLIRRLLTDGKTSMSLIFTRLFSNHSSNEEKKSVLVPFGYSRGTLMQIAELLKRGQTVRFSDFEVENASFLEIILTNMVFGVPRHRIDECFSAFDEFDSKCLAAADFLWRKAPELSHYIAQKKIDLFPSFGGNTKKNLKRYLITRFIACLTKFPKGDKFYVNTIIDGGPKQHWSSGLRARFYENSEKFRKTKNYDHVFENAILCLVVNAPGDILYSLLSLELNVKKYNDAIARNKERSGFPTVRSDDEDEEN